MKTFQERMTAMLRRRDRLKAGLCVQCGEPKVYAKHCEPYKKKADIYHRKWAEKHGRPAAKKGRPRGVANGEEAITHAKIPVRVQVVKAPETCPKCKGRMIWQTEDSVKCLSCGKIVFSGEIKPAIDVERVA